MWVQRQKCLFGYALSSLLAVAVCSFRIIEVDAFLTIVDIACDMVKLFGREQSQESGTVMMKPFMILPMFRALKVLGDRRISEIFGGTEALYTMPELEHALEHSSVNQELNDQQFLHGGSDACHCGTTGCQGVAPQHSQRTSSCYVPKTSHVFDTLVQFLRQPSVQIFACAWFEDKLRKS